MDPKDIPPFEKHDVAFDSGQTGPHDAECARCNATDHRGDLRTLRVACLYALHELDIPWDHVGDREDPFYTVRVCKACRADFIGALRRWYRGPINRAPVGSGIYVMRDGAATEVTEAEFRRNNPGREPVRARDVKLPGLP